MPGNVLVDDTEIEEAPPQPSSWWLAGLGAIVVVVVLVALTGRSDSVAVPTTLTLPEVVVPEDRWSQLELPGTGALTDVTATDGGYVAVGEGPQIWWSSDLSSWDWVTVPDVPPSHLTAVTAFADGAVAVGAASADGRLLEAVVWRTDTGPTWEEVSVAVEAPSGLQGVAMGDGRLVAWGWKGSPGDFAPNSEPLLLVSEDGVAWSEVEMPEDLHISSVTWLDGTWYASGFAIGRAALWSSPDLELWYHEPTDEMLFGWDIRRVSHDEAALVADLVGLDEEGSRRWRREGDGSWVALEPEPGLSFDVMTTGGEEFGVGGGRLWAREEDRWTQVELQGEVRAAADGVAVGSYLEQPAIWVERSETAALVPVTTDGRWETVADLGEATYVGSWPVADGWIVAAEERWWFVNPAGVEAIGPPGPVWTIQRIGEEWVSLPTMHWTSDGIEWEERPQPWELAGPARVEAVSEIDGEVVAVGRNHRFLWAVASSADQGRSWEMVSSPSSATPLWTVVGTPEGFAATAARSRGTDEVVVSPDGRNWEALLGGSVIVAAGDLPAALTESGEVLLFDTGERIVVPRVDITGIRRDRERLVVKAGGRLWIGPGEWSEIPVGPPHGVGGQTDPIPLNGRLLVVETDRDSMRILEWSSD